MQNQIYEEPTEYFEHEESFKPIELKQTANVLLLPIYGILFSVPFFLAEILYKRLKKKPVRNVQDLQSIEIRPWEVARPNHRKHFLNADARHFQIQEPNRNITTNRLSANQHTRIYMSSCQGLSQKSWGRRHTA